MHLPNIDLAQRLPPILDKFPKCALTGPIADEAFIVFSSTL